MNEKARRSPTRGTSEVSLLVATSVISGLVAASAAAPFIAIVDKAITANASGRQSLFSSMKDGFKMLARSPIQFIKQPSFRWICLVYGSTYVVANLTQLFFELNNRSWTTPKFISTSITNVGLSVLKDRAFAKMFAIEGAVARPFPKLALASFALRDTSTILASFSLPPRITPIVEEHFNLSHTTARTTVQLLTPLAMQIFSVPLHLVGLDMYNSPVRSNMERLGFVKREYVKTVIARWCRILPAFSIAGVLNIELLELSRDKLNISADDSVFY